MEETRRGRHDTYRSDAFPGAHLALYRTPEGEAIGLACHDGSPDGQRRVHAAHVAWTKARAALHVAEGLPDGFYEQVGTALPIRGANGVASGDDQRRDAVASVAEALTEDDPYRATRQVEDAFRIEGNHTLYALVAGAVADVAVRMRSEEFLIEAARRMEAASPGPSTLMNRMLAEMRGLPAPEDRIHELPERDGCLSKAIGTLDLTVGARGKPRQAELTLVVRFEPGSAEFEGDVLTFVGMDVHLVHDPVTWDVRTDGHLYGDLKVQAAVLALLELRGLGGFQVDWSEHGRQTAEHGDMDADAGLAEALWPEVIAAERARHTAGPAV